VLIGLFLPARPSAISAIMMGTPTMKMQAR